MVKQSFRQKRLQKKAPKINSGAFFCNLNTLYPAINIAALELNFSNL